MLPPRMRKRGMTMASRGLLALGLVLVWPARGLAAEPTSPPAPRERVWSIGVTGVGMVVPPLRATAVNIDPRYVSDSVTMGGVGLFGRYRPVPWVATEVGINSGSLRYRDRGDDGSVSHDLVVAHAGLLLFLARGQMSQFALDGGMGGIYQHVGYRFDDRDGAQDFGSGFVYVGAGAEFILERVSFILSLRSFGVFTDRDKTRSRGSLFDAVGESRPDTRAPVSTVATYVVVSGGISYRF